jgi:predicted DNA repair protein MutK
MAGASLLTLLDDIAMLLDDVAVLSKVAAKKTAGVLGDDLAVNAEQLSGGLKADRELPVVWAVFKGSMLNKAILVPIALLLSYFLPVVIMPLLMIGGAYLCYEGFEKVWHTFTHKEEQQQRKEALIGALEDPEIDIKSFEKDKIKGAIRTDFILSAEIIIIALGTIATQPITTQVSVLVFIAILMTVGVYGLVAGIVKIDDGGLLLIRDKSSGIWPKIKRGLGYFMIGFAPKLMKFLAIAGTIAMWLVGGSLITHGVPSLHHFIESASSYAASMTLIGDVLAAITPLLIDLIVGFLLGAILVFFHLSFSHLRSKAKSQSPEEN